MEDTKRIEQRRRSRSYRKRQAEKGLVCVLLWCYPSDVKRLREIARGLRSVVEPAEGLLND